jgi:hypothetical protein
MAYDVVGESVKLIQSRDVLPVQRLSRRRRFAAMSVDVAGDVAVTSFARRGAGCVWHDVHVLAFRAGQWVLLGGGGGNGENDLLTSRPVRLPPYLSPDFELLGDEADPGPIASSGGGGVKDSGYRRWFGVPGRWISYGVVRVNVNVDTLWVENRLLPVPWHGLVAVVWVGKSPQPVVAVDRAGAPLAKVLIRSR